MKENSKKKKFYRNKRKVKDALLGQKVLIINNEIEIKNEPQIACGVQPFESSITIPVETNTLEQRIESYLQSFANTLSEHKAEFIVHMTNNNNVMNEFKQAVSNELARNSAKITMLEEKINCLNSNQSIIPTLEIVTNPIVQCHTYLELKNLNSSLKNDLELSKTAVCKLNCYFNTISNF